MTPTDRQYRNSDSYISMLESITAGDLRVFFQPIVDLYTHRTFAVEALVRCRKAGFHDPAVLIQHAVDLGFCGRLGKHIRNVAVSECSGLPVFLNVHPVELSERWLVQPDDAIFTHDNDVYVEITESVPFTDFNLVRSVINEVRSRGHLFLVVDDLGAGFSNLKRIIDLEPKLVKLDRELVKDVDKSQRQQTLVASIVQLCMKQGAKVVAEGIETEQELKAVIDAGVHYGQGFLLARPNNPIPEVRWPN